MDVLGVDINQKQVFPVSRSRAIFNSAAGEIQKNVKNARMWWL